MLSLTETKLQFTHTSTTTTFYGANQAYVWHFPIRYKIINSQKKQVHRCSKLFWEAREGICSQEIEQGSSFQNISFEQSWATKECGNFFICIYFSICFRHNQLGTGMWWAEVTPKLLWHESVQLLFMSTSTEGQVRYSGSIIPPQSKVAKKASWAAQGLSAQVCQERAGRHWHSLWVCAQLLNQAVPIHWGETQILTLKGH